jgi:hypothetical protein
VLAGGGVAEAQQVDPADRARLGPGLVGDPGPQRRPGRVRPRHRRRCGSEAGQVGGLGNGQLDRVPQPAGLDLDIEGEPAGEPMGVQQH